MPAHILVIDDDDHLRALIARGLQRRGYIVDTAENGRVGLRVFDAEQPAVVITDILMPDMEGIEVILTLKARPAPPKIIAMSGGGRFVGRDFLKWAAHLGADEVLPKPFRISALVALVSVLLAENDNGADQPPFSWRPTLCADAPLAGGNPSFSTDNHARG